MSNNDNTLMPAAGPEKVQWVHARIINFINKLEESRKGIVELAETLNNLLVAGDTQVAIVYAAAISKKTKEIDTLKHSVFENVVTLNEKEKELLRKIFIAEGRTPTF